MKYLVRSLLSVLGIGVTLFLWMCAGSPYLGLGVRTPFESAAEYHLRMMYYHGRETKDGRDLLHGDELVALGERAVPALADAARGHLNPRFEPKPHEVLARFPEAAHKELSRRIETLEESPHSSPEYRREHFLHQRINLTTVLILVSNDWSYLDLWMSDLAEHPNYEGYVDEGVRMMGAMLRVLLENESAPEPFLRTGPWSHVAVTPKFQEWWTANRGRIIAQSSKEGFHNARGWVSGWYRDQQRAQAP